MKPLIGILANVKTDENEGPYADYYMINKVYIDKLRDVGASPLGILEINDETLKVFSGFVLIGGHRITENHYKIIEHCLTNNKPLLGICNGMQAIVLYSYLYEECLKDNIDPTTSNLYKKYGELRARGVNILEKLEHHGGELSQRKIAVFMENLVKFKHDINIKNNTMLFDIYESFKINVFSIHTYGVYEVASNLEVMALSDDNVVEAIKYKDKPIIGIQFHAELDENDALFKHFIEMCITNEKASTI